MKAQEIRSQFLDFFRSKGHQIVDSAPIVLKDDPTLMFTNAGMNQFKDLFLGVKKADFTRVADSQKCMRVTGKQNDLEDVGHDTYHHTMFEMLGNWSFGDYYKKDAIGWAFELITKIYGIPEDRIYATVFGGEDSMNLGVDKEAEDHWLDYLPKERILYFGPKDNFWSMGDTGPCGPCSEIHVDLRSDEERAQTPGADLVNADHPELIEIWNLVFMQYNRNEFGKLEPLPAKHIDTGMGFERLCMALQGKKSSYDTDLFAAYRNFLENELGCKYGRSHEEDVAMRVVMDHIRAITFTIADGQLPSNNKAGYVIRRILRRASRYAFQFLHQSEPFLHRMVPLVAAQYADVFPSVKEQEDFIRRIVEEEERSFLRTLEQGTRRFEHYIAHHRGDQVVEGDFAFEMYDTFGFPLDLTELMAREKGWTVDLEGYDARMNQQRESSRAATEMKAGDWQQLGDPNQSSEFVGYDQTRSDAQILRFRTVKTGKGQVYQIVLDRTPFYAESGGQIGDSGILTANGEQIQVLDTKKENNLIVHFTDRLPADPKGTWVAEVDTQRRRSIMANHSATHLLHAALRQVLGEHVEQRGSLVHPDGLRFDFSHFARMTDEEIQQVEDLVNEKIAASVQLGEFREVAIEEAKGMGAMALFGEKYGDKVRVITFDPAYSVELCGGTHVTNTAEIRLFKIVSESSSAAGIRRIEAVTGSQAVNYLSEKAAKLDQITELMRAAQDVVGSVEDMLARQKQLEKELEKLNAEKVGDLQKDLRDKAKSFGEVHLLAEVVPVPGAGELKTLAFDLRKNLQNTVIVLGADIDGKALLNVTVTEDLEAGGKYHAGNLVRELAKEVQGGGGGQPHFASAGGKNPAGLPQAMKKAEDLVQG